MTYYHVYCFTDWISDPLIRHKIGWSLLGMQGLVILLSLSTVIVEVVKTIID